ncbi:MAG TPA: hypothetical protein VNV87_01095 [Acidimicrobiales bacterium]|jgi:hypothetical protein|nr:hypothetical protein [Acidimicrobiales bacterium]
MGSELSRRGFLTLGAAVAGAALIPVGATTAAASERSNRYPYALTTWQQMGNGALRVELPHGRSTTMRTQKVTDLAPSGGRSSQGDEFALTFSVDGAVPAEGTHTLSHSTLGRFPLFLSPAGNGVVTALVNRSHGVGHR